MRQGYSDYPSYKGGEQEPNEWKIFPLKVEDTFYYSRLSKSKFSFPRFLGRPRKMKFRTYWGPNESWRANFRGYKLRGSKYLILGSLIRMTTVQMLLVSVFPLYNILSFQYGYDAIIEPTLSPFTYQWLRLQSCIFLSGSQLLQKLFSMRTWCCQGLRFLLSCCSASLNPQLLSL